MLTLQEIGRAVREVEYAVRGPVVARAQELESQGREIVYCHIGNPQAFDQRPITWVRQVISIAAYPELLDRVQEGTFPKDVVDVAKQVLSRMDGGLGTYTESHGYRFVREAVADFIRERDGIPADPEAVYLTDGASKAAQSVLRLLISDEKDGILIPFPQYPLYSASITLFGGAKVPYPLDESSDWKLSLDAIERAHDEARARGIRVRGIVVINPGNPTGSVLEERNVEQVLDFAHARHLSVLADEVYQDNVYLAGNRFVSFASVLERRAHRDVSLFSFHSVSKGYLGECGLRGGYVECRNVPGDVRDELVKLQSVSLCANSVGQLATYLLVRPPRPGEPSHALWERERREVIDLLRRKAEMVERGLNAVPGIQCSRLSGAMYAFPRITLPEGVTDEEYCFALLEETGICVVPGTGFGQEAGTSHFRTTILPPMEKIESVVKRLAEFHASFTRRRSR